jgi:hypothetical protein
MKKEAKWIIIAIIIAIISVTLIASFYLYKSQKNVVTLQTFLYTKDKQLIQKPLAVVGGVEGVYYVNFKGTITNTGDLNLVCVPVIYKSSGECWNIVCPALAGYECPCIPKDPTKCEQPIYFPLTELNLPVGSSNYWTSDLVDVSNYLDCIYRWHICIKCRYEYAGKTYEIMKCAYKDLSIKPDPKGNFTIVVG